MKYYNYFLIIFVTFFLEGCVGHDAQKIAEAYCKCREVEKYEGTMQGTQCFEDWNQKYGKIRFSESQKKTFFDITNACNPKN